ncbi:MAG: TIGR01777 family oxidoreductase, partial [Thermomicrobiales bacterium]
MPPTSLTFHSTIPASAEEVLAWHARDGAFERLTPPWANVRVLETHGGIEPGARRTLKIGLGPMSLRWSLEHEALQRGDGFTDEQIEGPFRSWRHEHRFIPSDDGTSVLEDRLTYALPLGAFGDMVAGRSIRRRLDDLFRYRHDQTRHDLHSLVCSKHILPSRVAITGASGLVGGHLRNFLTAAGVEVYTLVRHEPKDDFEIFWNPKTGQIDRAKLEGMDAVVHLAGTSIAGGRWTESRKRSIRESRVEGTRLLASTMAGLSQPPRVLVSTSAVGYYGDAGDVTLDESAPKGTGFLADVCEAWEASTHPATEAGIRVVTPRFGIVLSGAGGMLPLVSMPFRLGVGGKLGSGNQMMSWIALDDLLGILLEAIVDDALEGPVNAVAPEPVSNREFTRILAHVLHRPSFLAVPAAVIKRVAGQLADEMLLVSQAAIPTKLQVQDFPFSFP